MFYARLPLQPCATTTNIHCPPDAIVVQGAEVLYRHLVQHPTHITFESPSTICPLAEGVHVGPAALAAHNAMAAERDDRHCASQGFVSHWSHNHTQWQVPPASAADVATRVKQPRFASPYAAQQCCMAHATGRASLTHGKLTQSWGSCVIVYQP